MADHNDLGNLAEEMAAEFLIDLGYKILTRNYRFQKAEIDIIAVFNKEIIIVEVKARSSDVFLEPQEAVTKRKIKLVVMAANEFMRAGNRTENVRFDIISVLPDDNGVLKIKHLPDAFEAFDAN
jgi:putative endonuclease